MNNNCDASRRKFLKTAGYVTPAVLTLAAIPSFASAGSARGGSHGGHRGNNGVGNGFDPQPPGNPPINDGVGTFPGNPGNRGYGRR